MTASAQSLFHCYHSRRVQTDTWCMTVLTDKMIEPDNRQSTSMFMYDYGINCRLQVRLKRLLFRTGCNMNINAIDNLINKVQYRKYHLQKLKQHRQKIQGEHYCTTHADMHLICKMRSKNASKEHLAAEVDRKNINLVDCHFKNLVVSDFLVKQNSQTFILIPSFKSHKDLTQYISNRTALSGQRWFLLSVHERK